MSHDDNPKVFCQDDLGGCVCRWTGPTERHFINDNAALMISNNFDNILLKTFLCSAKCMRIFSW